MQYIVDTNFFVQAHRAYYPMDVFPSFWNKVRQLAEAGTIISIDKVKHEIYLGRDALKNWCEANLPDHFFQDSSVVMSSYAHVVGWAAARTPAFSEKALAEFMDADEADAFLVAYALSDKDNRVLVTQEVSDPKILRKVKIPDGCLAVGVRYINMIEMFRELGETF